MKNIRNKRLLWKQSKYYRDKKSHKTLQKLKGTLDVFWRGK